MKVLFLLCIVLHLVLGNNDSIHNHVDITLIGAYGDLAKKYLWNALFKLYEDNLSDKWTYQFFGGASKNVTLGTRLLNESLKQGLKCSDDKKQQCQKNREKFVNLIKYFQFKEEKDYAEHCSNLFEVAAQHHCHKGHLCEYQNIIYLSVPPFVYKTISSYIASHCRPVDGAGSLKVVFEKPFGHSKASAIDLVKSVEENLHESEIYRADHYLGKQTVQEILSFRKNNLALEELLNNRFVERIEIVMKETIGVMGRTKFYDKYGVVADVMQNHLSEILYLLTMDLPINLETSDETMKKKLEIMRRITTVTNQDVVMGQYQDYQSELNNDFANCSQAEISKTPTFAGVKLGISSARWHGVPILMIAGKKLDERKSYARIVFKEKMFFMKSNQKCSQESDLIFHIGYGSLGKPAILVSRNLDLNVLQVSNQWVEVNDLSDLTYLGKRLSCYKVFSPRVVHDAYEFLVKQVFFGHQEHFLSSPALLESWRVWGPVIEERIENLQVYANKNDTESRLDFTYASDELKFLNPAFYQINYEKFLGGEVIHGSNNAILKKLAMEITNSAQSVIGEKGEFHIAFSGGTSPLMLFDFLVAYWNESMFWENVHVWQVDERCTLNSSLSNFNSLSSRLIDKLPRLKYKNIHPMPIEISFEVLCNEEGARLYEKWLKLSLSTPPQLDFIILGMGSDGHTASLFPFHEVLKEKEKLVAIADETTNEGVSQRMTMTYPLIGLSKKIAILAIGNKKCDLLQELHENQCLGENVERFPICKIPDLPSPVSWFIDESCNAIFIK